MKLNSITRLKLVISGGNLGYQFWDFVKRPKPVAGEENGGRMRKGGEENMRKINLIAFQYFIVICSA